MHTWECRDEIQREGKKNRQIISWMWKEHGASGSKIHSESLEDFFLKVALELKLFQEVLFCIHISKLKKPLFKN